VRSSSHAQMSGLPSLLTGAVTLAVNMPRSVSAEEDGELAALHEAAGCSVASQAQSPQAGIPIVASATTGHCGRGQQPSLSNLDADEACCDQSLDDVNMQCAGDPKELWNQGS